MPRVTVWIPAELHQAAADRVPGLSWSKVVQNGAAAALACDHRHLECQTCREPASGALVASEALSRFYADLLHELVDLVDDAGTAEGPRAPRPGPRHPSTRRPTGGTMTLLDTPPGVARRCVVDCASHLHDEHLVRACVLPVDHHDLHSDGRACWPDGHPAAGIDGDVGSCTWRGCRRELAPAATWELVEW